MHYPATNTIHDRPDGRFSRRCSAALLLAMALVAVPADAHAGFWLLWGRAAERAELKAAERAAEALAKRAMQVERAGELSAHAFKSPSAVRSVLSEEALMRLIKAESVKLPAAVDRSALDGMIKRLFNTSLRDIGTVPRSSFKKSLKSSVRDMAQFESQQPSSKTSFNAFSGILSFPVTTIRGRVIRAEVNLYKLADKISEIVVCERFNESAEASRAYFGRGRSDPLSVSNRKDECPR